ncbi:snaclec aspercetin subunit alpha-like [Crassostrea angulata]|uniref:snaclec aspercetin subunit alpha-like n=1 Tax=Magallana angulata TaxID=2784310 RepID=UPI0022B0BD43|nr:snaclec aspercetin subunit alpha-like [Crassostrea angulata]
MSPSKIGLLAALFDLILKSNPLPLFDCPSEWIEHNSQCYKFVFHPHETYTKAQVFCKENGGEVLGVESQTEHSFVRNWLLNFDIERQVASYRDQTLLY